MEITHRDKNIDLIKCLACIGVVGLHTFQKDSVMGYRLLYVICGISIPFFFMCAGYLLMPEKRDNAYYFRKIKALLRIYLIWSVPIAVLLTIAKMVFGESGYTNLTDLIYEIAVNSVGGFIQKGYCWHLWYIGAMIIEYIAIAAITSFHSKTESKEDRVVLICWIICTVISMGVQTSSYVFRHPVQQSIIQTFRLWTWTNYILIGLIIRNKRDMIVNVILSHKRRWLVIFIICVCILAWCYQMFIGDNVIHTRFAEYLYDDLLTICFNVLLFCVLLGVRIADRLETVIGLLAPSTLGIYLIHPLLLRLFRKMIPDLMTIAGGIPAFLIVLLVSYVAARIIRVIPGGKKIIEL